MGKPGLRPVARAALPLPAGWPPLPRPQPICAQDVLEHAGSRRQEPRIAEDGTLAPAMTRHR
ncbi:hypothetical protein [Paracoccus thiocyanatus]|uniref:hypothetical protein n=1 Tax=Paracoccus thiocyanatus TaxID=34006 RepID=UPI00122CA31E|nr:hypothetical protein [Paracoccus thiocyanatus]